MSLRSKNRSRKLRIEQFEARQMMAGDFGAVGDIGGAIDEIASPEDPLPGNMPTAYELNLNSLPGAPASLFLDFNGHYQTESMFDTAGFGGYTNILTPAYNTDGDPNTFSLSEQNDIRSIWALVAEDFAPFNINVTTVDPDPGNLHPERPYLRVVISGASDFTGGGNWGISEDDWITDPDSYADPGDPNVVYAFTRVPNAAAVTTQQIALTISHESGHAFGLTHDSYNTGNEKRSSIMRDGLVPTEPIPQRMVWWDGDMAVIAGSDNGFGYRPDEHVNSFPGAAMMTTNVGLYARGVIETTSDVDMFRFETGGGFVSIQLDVAFGVGVANLDSEMLLYDSKGTLINFAGPQYSLDGNIYSNLAAGTYYVAVGSRGLAGDVGQYTLNIKEDTGAHIVSSKFQTLSSTQMGVTVTFNEAINWLTFTPADIRINGGLPGAGVVSVQRLADPKQFLIIINAASTTSPSVSIGPDILDLFGNRMDQNKNGVNGESSDYYVASPFKLAVKEVKTPTTTTRPRTRMLSTTAVDAYFTTY